LSQHRVDAQVDGWLMPWGYSPIFGNRALICPILRESVEIVLAKNAECYIVDVRDFGCGINEEDLKEVLTAFYTTKHGQGGAGLGMAIVHSLLTDALRGTIAIASEVGRGTSVSIRLPKHLTG